MKEIVDQLKVTNYHLGTIKALLQDKSEESFHQRNVDALRRISNTISYIDEKLEVIDGADSRIARTYIIDILKTIRNDILLDKNLMKY